MSRARNSPPRHFTAHAAMSVACRSPIPIAASIPLPGRAAITALAKSPSSSVRMRAPVPATSTGYTPRSTSRPPPVITRPCGRCAWWRGLNTTVAVNPDCSSAARMACPAASLTPSGFPLPRNPAHASAAASVACTSSNDSSRCASKEGTPLLCCSIFVLGCLGFFQQLRGTKLHPVDPALQERRPRDIAEQRVRPVRARAELRVELARDKPRVVGELDDLDQASVGREPAEHHAPLAH